MIARETYLTKLRNWRDKQVIKVKIPTEGRALVFDDVVARVSPKYKLAMHIDTDEANAAAVPGSCIGEILD